MKNVLFYRLLLLFFSFLFCLSLYKRRANLLILGSNFSFPNPSALSLACLPFLLCLKGSIYFDLKYILPAGKHFCKKYFSIFGTYKKSQPFLLCLRLYLFRRKIFASVGKHFSKKYFSMFCMYKKSQIIYIHISIILNFKLQKCPD
jgi:hypothetical protein